MDRKRGIKRKGKEKDREREKKVAIIQMQTLPQDLSSHILVLCKSTSHQFSLYMVLKPKHFDLLGACLVVDIYLKYKILLQKTKKFFYIQKYF